MNDNNEFLSAIHPNSGSISNSNERSIRENYSNLNSIGLDADIANNKNNNSIYHEPEKPKNIEPEELPVIRATTKPTPHREEGTMVKVPDRLRTSSGKSRINLGDVIQETSKPTVEEDPKSVMDRIYSEVSDNLELTLARKKKEMNDFVSYLEAKDQANRLAIAEGIEEAPTSEIKYINDGEPEYIGKKVAEESYESDEDFEAALEYELNETERNAEVYANSKQNTEKQVKIMSQNEIKNNILNNKKVEDDFSYLDDMRYDELFPSEEEEETIEEDNSYEDDIPLFPEEESVEEELDTTEIKEEKAVEQKVIEPEKINVEDKIIPKSKVETEEKSNENKEILDKFFNNKLVVKNDIETPKSDIPDTNDFKLDEEDFSDVDDDDENSPANDYLDENSDEVRELMRIGRNNLRSEVLSKIINTAKNIDVTHFKVTKRVSSLQEILNRAKEKGSVVTNGQTGTWSLMYAGRPYISTPLTGPEIALLGASEDNQTYSTQLQQLKILYAHDANPYKPKTFEAWCKTIPYADLDEIYMAAYVATYSSANYLPIECIDNKCRNQELIVIKEDMADSMTDFKTERAKNKFNTIRKTPLTPENSNEYESVIVPINEFIAIGFKLPSIYNYQLELRSVSESFLEKYRGIIGIISCIDDIYCISEDSNELRPVEYKRYVGDISKTLRSKIATYSKILDSLTINEYNKVVTYLGTLSSADNEINYKIPEAKCSKCGQVVPSRSIMGKYLVFTQLGLMNLAGSEIE